MQSSGYKTQTVRLSVGAEQIQEIMVMIASTYELEIEEHVPSHPAGCKSVSESFSVIPHAIHALCPHACVNWSGDDHSCSGSSELG